MNCKFLTDRLAKIRLLWYNRAWLKGHHIIEYKNGKAPQLRQQPKDFERFRPMQAA